MTAAGPLAGARVVELAGFGPGPHAAMVLADLGADVVRVERPGTDPVASDQTLRGRRRVVADLGTPAGRDVVLDLAAHADVLLEGFRPGVVERLGVGPADCAGVNPALVYARMTAWGQDGPLAHTAAHDLNVLAATGVLAAIGSAEAPAVPLNLVADYGGGSLLAVVGILAALVERATSGRGQVVDAAMLDGVALLGQIVWSLRGQGRWNDRRAANILDGGAPFYSTYAAADGRHVAVGAIEPQFFAALLEGLGLDAATLPAQHDRTGWPVLRAAIAGAIAARPRDAWTEAFAGVDACVSAVLDWEEVATHPQVAERGVMVEVGGVRQAAPAPRFSRSATAAVAAVATEFTDAHGIIAAWAGSA